MRRSSLLAFNMFFFFSFTILFIGCSFTKPEKHRCSFSYLLRMLNNRFKIYDLVSSRLVLVRDKYSSGQKFTAS